MLFYFNLYPRKLLFLAFLKVEPASIKLAISKVQNACVNSILRITFYEIKTTLLFYLCVLRLEHGSRTTR